MEPRLEWCCGEITQENEEKPMVTRILRGQFRTPHSKKRDRTQAASRGSELTAIRMTMSAERRVHLRRLECKDDFTGSATKTLCAAREHVIIHDRIGVGTNEDLEIVRV
jgi:hypothetical protein